MPRVLRTYPGVAQVAELVDALVSGTSAERRGGSSPLLGTSLRCCAASAWRACSGEGCCAEALAKSDWFESCDLRHPVLGPVALVTRRLRAGNPPRRYYFKKM